ncbi:MAG TPA: hypothetical protein PKM21_02315 [Anaerolineales bacterium]|nr:hypothetical protein [Anaerolineales bacterium]
MKTRLATLLLLVLAVLLGGCSGLTGPDLPTPIPTEYLPTVVAVTAQAAQRAATETALPLLATGITQARPTNPAPSTPNPTPASASPSITPATSLAPTDTPTSALPTPSPTNTRRPSQTPTVTMTPGIPLADIQIYSLGPMSKVISPLLVGATINTVPGGYYVVELWIEPLSTGQQPRLLLRDLHNFVSEPLSFIYLADEYEFELSRLSEVGQLRISTFDAQDRPVAVASVDLLLLQVGENEINPPGDLMQPIVIREPAPNHLIQGGKLTISGLARLSEISILNIELVTTNGKVVGTSDIYLTGGEDGNYAAFNSTINYLVTETTWARLIVKETGRRIVGIRQLASFEILLSP